ncbi:MAG: phosphoenolpyruvate carboxykinase (ATP) [Capsulimonadaceae bacterium]|nr:phosphoenolpyruvate carboxykinase (ATP) [Capsulimonadaceae bacterium]
MPELNDFNVGFPHTGRTFVNLTVPELIEHIIRRGEGELADNGAIVVRTGKYTGRSPKDKFIIDNAASHDQVGWGAVNQPFEPAAFDAILGRAQSYLQTQDLYVFDAYAGADPEHLLKVRFIHQLPYHSLFVHQLFIRPTEEQLKTFVPDFTVFSAAKMKADAARDKTKSETGIFLDFERKLGLVVGTEYGGENKKGIFTVLNFLLPQKNVFPMHCSANTTKDGNVALFFGLSGTGKTTLSADPLRDLIGDDEHGWSDNGVFNFEGGCYAKTINLSAEGEPQIWSAIRYGSVLENVVLDPKTKTPDYDDGSLTENTRAAYPIDFIPGAVIPSVGGHPKTVVFLTADAFGVLPPISKLTPDQAQYHFLSGYTSKLAGTERGITEPETTFSTCFGSPFMPLPPARYAKLLGERLAKHGATAYLVNTGWSGGPYGVGKRMKLSLTRAMVTAAVSGALDNVETKQDPIFGLHIPVHIDGVPDDVLQPRNTWADKAAYDATAKKLASKFVENFKKYEPVPDQVRNAGPKA